MTPPTNAEPPTFEEWQTRVSALAYNCPMCGPTLLCPKCGNNACNSGHGEVDGKECDLCPAIYALQDVLAMQP